MILLVGYSFCCKRVHALDTDCTALQKSDQNLLVQKIRTVELDGKVIKLQIVSLRIVAVLTRGMLGMNQPLRMFVSAVGHSRTGTFQDNHQQLLQRRPWHHCESIAISLQGTQFARHWCCCSAHSPGCLECRLFMM